MQTRQFLAEHLDGLKEALDNIKTDDFEPALAIVFASVQHDLVAIQAEFDAREIEVFGATSAGELLDNGNGDNVFEESIAVMLFDIDRDFYRLQLISDVEQSSYEIGQLAGQWVVNQPFEDSSLLVMTSGMRTDGEQVVNGIKDQAGDDIPIFGGMAGDDMQFQRTFVFDNEHVETDSVIVLAFDRNKVDVRGVASSGWQAVAGEKIITQSDGNVVFTIDDQPAIDVYLDYLGISPESFSGLAPQYPLQIQRDGYSVMRAALIVDFDNDCVIYAGSVPEGSKVRFCVPPGTEITDHTLQELQLFHDEEVDDADALVLFSCKGRHQALGPMAEDEVRPIQQLWNAPLIGFYTYGEIGNKRQATLDFHNETCVLVTLKEK